MRYRILIYICLMLGTIGLLSAFPANSDEPIIQWQLTQHWPHSRHSSIWEELKDHFDVKHFTDKAAVQKQIHFLSRRQDYIDELTTNARPYIFYIYSQTRKYHMPAEIALVPMIESDYDPYGISRTGATGLWQMMPGTASGLGLKINWWYDGRRSVIKSTQAALAHLRYLHSYFGTWLLALAAYDCGDGTVRAAIRRNKRLGLPTDFWHLKLPKETKLYVPKLLALAAIIADRKHYGLSLNPIPNSPFFEAIRLKGQIEINHIAKLAETTVSVIRKLNPAFRRWSTTPKGEYWILLPEKQAETLQHNLDKFKSNGDKIVAIKHYRIQSGDTLSSIARINHTSISILKSLNNLKSNIIRIGQELLIPNALYHKHLAAHTKTNKRIAEDKIPGPKRSIHIVKRNETLASIASHYHVKPAQIRYWNQLGYHSSLKPDQKLIIWVRQTVHHTAKKAPTKKHPHLVTHTIQPGQSLKVVAHKYHVSTHNIVAWNHLQNKKSLYIGEKLKIYLY